MEKHNVMLLKRGIKNGDNVKHGDSRQVVVIADDRTGVKAIVKDQYPEWQSITRKRGQADPDAR